jgi:XTP/dITP diphosphohydrolase
LTTVHFASGNENKFLEIESLFEKEKETKKETNMQVAFSKILIKEIQSDSMIEVAEDKVRKAFKVIKKPLIVEDDGLFIEDLNGFPGIYSSFVFNTIGNKGILDLLRDNKKNRKASFLSIFSFFDGKTIETFSGETAGYITTRISPSGWGFDPIFQPINEYQTYGQIDMIKKNEISHRSKAFRKFLKWYKINYQNTDEEREE